jgi:hypothetical protein
MGLTGRRGAHGRHAVVPLVALPFETWRAVVATLREPGLPPWMAGHADRIERLPDGHGPGEAEVALNLSDDA